MLILNIYIFSINYNRFESKKKMLVYSILFLLLSNAVSMRRDKSILYNRVSISMLCYCTIMANTNLYITYLKRGIGIYSGLFHINSITLIFHMFIFIISLVILQLTGFYPRKIWLKEFSSLKRLFFLL
jgi:NADH-ubiquinone oxidoreductase chain 2